MAPRLTHAPAPAIDDAFPAKGAFAARLRAGPIRPVARRLANAAFATASHVIILNLLAFILSERKHGC